MRYRTTSLALALLAMTGTAAAAAPRDAKAAAAATGPTEAVQAEIARLAKIAGGPVGVAAWRLDGTGPKLLLNADQAFPMASTFKVAVAGRILERVDKGELTLGQLVPVRPEQLVPSDVIAEQLIHPGVSLSVHNLLELMLTHSDNTATDVLTEVAGGPAAVTAWLKGQGIVGQRIDRDTAGLLRDFFGAPQGPFMQVFEEFAKTHPELEDMGGKPNPAFDDDPRDSSTPTAMANLLTRIYSGKALSAASTKVLGDIMARCHTGKARLLGLLPTGTVVAHKTGTIGGTVNDVGVITLPGDAGKLVIAVFVKKSTASMADRERAIAEIARAAHDYYLFVK